MARKNTTRGQKAARTRARNKKLALRAAEQARQNEIAEAQQREYAANLERERITEARVSEAYRMGLNEGRMQGLDRGRNEGYRQAQQDLDAAAKNLGERQTELGSVATVVDSMAKVVDAGSQALTNYFGDKRNGPNAPALTAIDETIGTTPARNGSRRTGANEVPISMVGIMSMLTGGPSPLG